MSKILIVDDHSDIRRLIRLLLDRTFEVLEADNGVDALDLARRHKPRVVVLDVMMPGELDGLQVLSAIKKDPELQETYVVMVTARGQSSDFETATNLGADAYFIKPFSPLALATHIRNRLAS
jgi:CheY-like chemotaxis protein